MKDGYPQGVLRMKKPHHRSRDITGERRGMLVALEFAGSDGRRSFWKFQCDCGGVCVKSAIQFYQGHIKSCGCSTARLISEAQTTHGMSHHPAFAVWRSMIDRCKLPTHQAWRNYGGRGITVCTRWQESFENFWEDMGPEYQRGLTLDRANNAEGYSKQNCRWVTHKEQARNTRANHLIPTPQGEMPVWQAEEVSGIGKTTLLYRVSAGWPAEQMFQPPDKRFRRSTTS